MNIDMNRDGVMVTARHTDRTHPHTQKMDLLSISTILRKKIHELVLFNVSSAKEKTANNNKLAKLYFLRKLSNR